MPSCTAALRQVLRLVFSLALGLALAGCAHPGSSTAQAPSPARDGLDSAAIWSGVGLLTLKGSAPFSWWALQTDSGQLWRLELPATLPSTALEPRQNCQVTASGAASDGLLGSHLLHLHSLEGMPRPELGAPENLRCQFSLKAL